MSIEFNWELFLTEQSLTQYDLCKKIDRSTSIVSVYVNTNYISIKMKARIEKILKVKLNKYLIKE